MSTNWKAGDRGVCINDTWYAQCDQHVPVNAPKKGKIYLVHGVHTSEDECLYLELAGFPASDGIGTHDGWGAEHFRKVIPKCDQLPHALHSLIGKTITITVPQIPPKR